MSEIIKRALSLALAHAHAGLQQSLGLSGLGRMAIARYDPRDNTVYPLVSSGMEAEFFDHMAMELDRVPSLALLATGTAPRVVDDLREGSRSGIMGAELIRLGFRSSLTYPLWHQGRFQGFLFMDSSQPRCFDEVTTRRLADVAHLFGSLLAASSAQADPLAAHG